MWGCGRGVCSPSIDNTGRLAGRGESTLSRSLLPCQAHLVCSSNFISFPLRFVLPNWPGTMFNQLQQQQGTCLPRLQCPPCPHRPPLPPHCINRQGPCQPEGLRQRWGVQRLLSSMSTLYQMGRKRQGLGLWAEGPDPASSHEAHVGLWAEEPGRTRRK